MKTSLREMMAVGTTAIALIAAETIFLAPAGIGLDFGLRLILLKPHLSLTRMQV